MAVSRRIARWLPARDLRFAIERSEVAAALTQSLYNVKVLGSMSVVAGRWFEPTDNAAAGVDRGDHLAS
jgi:hypothetical protein